MELKRRHSGARSVIQRARLFWFFWINFGKNPLCSVCTGSFWLLREGHCDGLPIRPLDVPWGMTSVWSVSEGRGRSPDLDVLMRGRLPGGFQTVFPCISPGAVSSVRLGAGSLSFIHFDFENLKPELFVATRPFCLASGIP